MNGASLLLIQSIPVAANVLSLSQNEFYGLGVSWLPAFSQLSIALEVVSTVVLSADCSRKLQTHNSTISRSTFVASFAV